MLFAGQPQTLAVPPPPQVARPMQLPQLTVPPQPSLGVPQLALSAAQVVGLQAQTLGTPVAPHACCAPTQVPQSSTPPQPSMMVPQFLPAAAQVVGAQPQTPGEPAPPQVLGDAQLPQLKV